GPFAGAPRRPGSFERTRPSRRSNAPRGRGGDRRSFGSPAGLRPSHPQPRRFPFAAYSSEGGSEKNPHLERTGTGKPFLPVPASGGDHRDQRENDNHHARRQTLERARKARARRRKYRNAALGSGLARGSPNSRRRGSLQLSVGKYRGLSSSYFRRLERDAGSFGASWLDGGLCRGESANFCKS